MECSVKHVLATEVAGGMNCRVQTLDTLSCLFLILIRWRVHFKSDSLLNFDNWIAQIEGILRKLREEPDASISPAHKMGIFRLPVSVLPRIGTLSGARKALIRLDREMSQLLS